MLYPPGFYYVKKPKRFVILSSDKSSERNLSCFFDIKKPRRIEHLESEEPFSSDPYFNRKINQFLGYQAMKHPIYAAAMMVPVALAFLFTVNQWAKNESGLKKKLITLPFLLLQLYPPFAALRLVVYLITRNRKWFDANRIYNQSVASIGKIFIIS